jgi:hypothetical protein
VAAAAAAAAAVAAVAFLRVAHLCLSHHRVIPR